MSFPTRDGVRGADGPRGYGSSGGRRWHGLVATLTVLSVISVSVAVVSPVAAAPDGPLFADVDQSAQFYAEIQWLGTQGISTGTPQASGLPLYKPVDSVSRLAMAAFLLRLSRESFAAPVTTTFADVDSTHPFFRAIEWMASKGISVGTAQPSGKPLFKPTDPVSRQAMALFLARYANEDVSSAPLNASFADVPLESSPAAAIGWMASQGISTGTPQASGLPLFLPASPVSRQAMAAFLYRLANLSFPAPLLQAVSAQGLGVRVTWAPQPEAVSYSVAASPVAGSTAPSCPSPAAALVSVPSTDTSVVMTGLCAGVAYTAQVTAVAGSGSSPASAVSAPVVPLVAQVPDSPLIASVTPRDGSLQASWSSSAYDGGAPLSGYALTVTEGSFSETVSVGPNASTAQVTGLTVGTPYSLSLVAVNSVGSSTPSIADGTPSVAYPASAPLDFTAVPDGTGSVALSWQAPVDDGGSPLTGYTVSYQQVAQAGDGSWSVVDGSVAQTIDAAAGVTSTIATTFETANAFYRFSVLATNGVGSGALASIANPVTTTVQISTSTVVLTQSTVNALSSVTATSLSWADPAPPDVQALFVGNIVVAQAAGLLSEGALRSVVAISDTGSVVTVTTENASLTEAFGNLSIASTINPVTGTSGVNPAASSVAVPLSSFSPPESGAGTFEPSIAGVQVVPASFGGNVTLSNSKTLAVDFPGVKGKINITPAVSVALEVHQNLVGIPDGASVTSSAKIDASANLTVGLVGKHSFKIGEFVGAPVNFQIGVVPLVIVPKVPIFLNLSGSTGLEVNASMTVGAAVSWSTQSPQTLTTTNLTTGPTITAGPIGGGSQSVFSATGTISLVVQVKAAIYGVGGPYFEAALILTGTIDFAPPVGQPFLSLTVRLDLKAGLGLDLFGFSASLEVPLTSLPFAPFVIQSVPYPAYMVSPSGGGALVGVPLALTATRTDGGTSAKTWGLIGAATGDSISSTGVFTAVAPAGRTVTVTVTDAVGVMGRTTLTVGDKYSSPGNVNVTQPGGRRFAAAFAWSAPTSTGGRPISYYRVVTQPATGNHTTTAPTITLTGLRAGTYTATIYAINAAGRTSPAASTVVTITATGILRIATNNTVIAWGDNSSGQSTVPSGLTRATAIATGSDHSLALKSDGTVIAWGANGFGQTSVPSGLTAVIAIAAGDYHSLALKSDGTVIAWGANYTGQANVPAGLSGVTAITAGREHSLALRPDGTVIAWGANRFGQSTVPSGLSGVTAITTSQVHSLALKSDGSVVAWGNNDSGQISVPSGLSGVTAIAAGGAHSVALRSNGTVVAWGYDVNGEATVPSGLSAVTAIAAADGHSLALRSDGTVIAWGANGSGQASVPAGLSGVTAVAARGAHSLAMVPVDQ